MRVFENFTYLRAVEGREKEKEKEKEKKHPASLRKRGAFANVSPAIKDRWGDS